MSVLAMAAALIVALFPSVTTYSELPVSTVTEGPRIVFVDLFWS